MTGGRGKRKGLGKFKGQKGGECGQSAVSERAGWKHIKPETETEVK